MTNIQKFWWKWGISDSTCTIYFLTWLCHTPTLFQFKRLKIKMILMLIFASLWSCGNVYPAWERCPSGGCNILREAFSVQSACCMDLLKVIQPKSAWDVNIAVFRLQFDRISSVQRYQESQKKKKKSHKSNSNIDQIVLLVVSHLAFNSTIVLFGLSAPVSQRSSNANIWPPLKQSHNTGFPCP